MACQTAATIVLVHLLSAVLLSQVPDTRTSPGAPAAHQDQESGQPASSAPASLPSAPPNQPQSLPNAPLSQTGSIVGTAIDVNNAIIPAATAVVEGPAQGDRHVEVANDKGFFEFTALQPGTYHVTVSAKGFANWTSPAVGLNPGQAVILTGSILKVAEAKTTVIVSSAQIAAEQVRIQEQQRFLGIIPNFYVVYEANAEPLTTKLKFHLAFKTVTDPITFLGTGVVAGIYQAADHPAFVQGMKGYGERYGSIYGDGVIDIMLGGAVLPSLLHQDPRYFYKGTGTKKSRILHAISYPFVCKGDNRHLQPNYSTIGGDLATAAIANTYYPAQNNGAAYVFENFLIGTGERVAASLAQEFIVARLTKVKAGRKDQTKK